MKEESFMTKFQKQMLTIAAAGALTAVTALPAMAFENEFHGIFNFNTVFSNYNNSTSGDINVKGLRDKNKMNNYFENRLRLQYIAKASDDLKLVTQFEFDNRFGDVNTDLDTDGATSQFELKHVYLDFNIGKSFNTKLGLMPYKDTIKGLFIDADAPAIMTTTKAGGYTLGLGFARYADDALRGTTGAVSRLGDANKDLFILDNTFNFSKDTKMALSYYFAADYAAATTGYGSATGPTPTAALFNSHTQKQAILLHTFGLSGETKLAGISLSGFAAMQTGVQKPDSSAAGIAANKLTGAPISHSRYFHGWAANVAANMNVGPGKLKSAFLFTSGDNSTNASSYKGWVSSSVNSYNESGMMILARNTYNSPTNTDQYVRRDVTNIALLTMGYDSKLTDKFNLNGNVGFAWAPSSVDAPMDYTKNAQNASDFMGTEINLEAGYQLYKNLKLQAQAGYMILGGYYNKSSFKSGTALSTNAVTNAINAATPENPYTMRLQARYSF
jgi:hypothetical protein